MASQLQAGPSTRGGAARAPPPASVEGPAPTYRATVQRCVALVDWWLVRGEDDKIRIAGYAERNRAARLFCSTYITLRHADGTLETADHKILLIRGPLNIPQMHCNGFPYEVSKYFRLGFPVQWERYANSNLNQMTENTQSPSKSTKYYIEKFLHGSFINSEEYNFTEVDSKSSKGPTGNADGPPSRGLSNLPNGTPRIQESSCNSGDYDNSVIKVTPSEGLCNGRIGMPDESCEDHVPTETCSGNIDKFPVKRLSSLANGISRIQEPSGNKSGDYHNSVSNTTASEGLCNCRMGMPDKSFENPGPGETCSGQTCQAAKPHELESLAKGLSPAFGLLQCSKDNTGRTLRSGKVCPHELEAAKGLSPAFGLLQCSKDNTGRTLRSGKVCLRPNGASFKKGHSKRKRVQQETLNMKVIPTKETPPPSDPTCQKNGGSDAQIPPADKLQSQDLGRRGRGRPRRKERDENI